MEQHIRTLGILHIVFGALGVLAAVIVLFVFGGLAALLGTGFHDESGVVPSALLGGIGAFVAVVLLALALPGLIAGIGLLQLRPWARILTIILSVFDLVHVPFGTALGVYGLWVLLSQPTERLFRTQ